MTTTRDAAGVFHIDGPPVRGFAIAEHPDGSGNRVEVIYKTLRFTGSKKECEDAYRVILDLIRAELESLNGAQVATTLHNKIIWWRRRVEYEQDPEDLTRFTVYFRLATTPKLPDEFWEKWGVGEGMPSRNAREVCG